MLELRCKVTKNHLFLQISDNCFSPFFAFPSGRVMLAGCRHQKNAAQRCGCSCRPIGLNTFR